MVLVWDCFGCFGRHGMVAVWVYDLDLGSFARVEECNRQCSC